MGLLALLLCRRQSRCSAAARGARLRGTTGSAPLSPPPTAGGRQLRRCGGGVAPWDCWLCFVAATAADGGAAPWDCWLYCSVRVCRRQSSCSAARAGRGSVGQLAPLLCRHRRRRRRAAWRRHGSVGLLALLLCRRRRQCRGGGAAQWDCWLCCSVAAAAADCGAASRDFWLCWCCCHCLRCSAADHIAGRNRKLPVE